MKVIDIQNLSLEYTTGREDKIYALNDVCLEIGKGESVAIVGESGCGKSTFANACLNLLPKNIRLTGSVLINNRSVLDKSVKELERIRGVEAGIVFQEPSASLNPVFTVKEQIEETIMAHYKDITKAEAEVSGKKLLREAGITGVERVYNSYPHQLSGGQQQRVMIAISLSCDPDILIADEPTTALDVTVQAQIVKLLKKLKKDRGLTLVLITHDLHLAVELCERVVVMYAGEVVEDGKIKKNKNAYHPYTRALFDIIPGLKSKKGVFKIIEGEVPEMKKKTNECYFAPRCAYSKKECWQLKPEIKENGKKHFVRCFFPLKGKK